MEVKVYFIGGLAPYELAERIEVYINELLRLNNYYYRGFAIKDDHLYVMVSPK